MEQLISKKQGMCYAALTLDLLYKMKIKITPEIFAEQMKLTYDLYEQDEVEREYELMKENNRIFNKDISGRANTYIINIFETSTQQKQAVERFCKNSSLELGTVYTAPIGENAEMYYKLIRDIRNKAMDVLIITIFSIYAMSHEEWAIVVKLCRRNGINIVEI